MGVQHRASELGRSQPARRANPIQISAGNTSRTLPPQTMHCCCCLDESLCRQPGYFFPILPSKHCSRPQLAECPGRELSQHFPCPGKGTVGSRQRSHRWQREAHGGVGIFRNVVLRRECRLLIPSAEGQSWDPVGCSGSARRSVGWAGQPKPGLGETISMCIPGRRMNMRDCDLQQG